MLTKVRGQKWQKCRRTHWLAAIGERIARRRVHLNLPLNYGEKSPFTGPLDRSIMEYFQRIGLLRHGLVRQTFSRSTVS